jgi:hypothetical protein
MHKRSDIEKLGRVRNQRKERKSESKGGKKGEM